MWTPHASLINNILSGKEQGFGQHLEDYDIFGFDNIYFIDKRCRIILRFYNKSGAKPEYPRSRNPIDIVFNLNTNVDSYTDFLESGVPFVIINERDKMVTEEISNIIIDYNKGFY